MPDQSKPQSRDSTQRQVQLDAEVARQVVRERPFLRGLLVTGAGACQGFARQTPLTDTTSEALFILCLKGAGWWEAHGRISIIHPRELLVLPPRSSHSCGPHSARPWLVHWVKAAGEHLPDYLRELALGPQTPVLRLGEESLPGRCFAEILQTLQRGTSLANLLHASNTLAYLLSFVIQKRHAATPENTDAVQRVAGAIIYMSEHLEEPLRVPDLARQAGFSAAHFAELFKGHTGCSPHEYLHLLRIHQACRLLRDSQLSLKEIAVRIGYRDPLYFSRQFKAFKGVAPSEYRRGNNG